MTVPHDDAGPDPTAFDPPSEPASLAISLAKAKMREMGVEPGDYQVVQARSGVLSRDADPYRWRLDFKTTSSLPTKRGGKVGKGGEMWFLVDLETGEVTQRRRGD